jgi:hypothetical protein
LEYQFREWLQKKETVTYELFFGDEKELLEVAKSTKLNLTNDIYGRNLHCPFRAIVFVCFFVTQRDGCASALGCYALPLSGRIKNEQKS